MTTDITELAQSMKAAAENAIGAHERLAAYPYDEIIDISQHEGEQIDIDITDINEFHEEANPVNVLALVEALEKARQRIDELENDEVRQRLANAEHQLHMAELAKHNLRASRKAQFRKRKTAEKRIAELEGLLEVSQEDLSDTEDAMHLWAERARKAESEVESFRTAYMEWSDKTAWVNTDRRFGVVKPLGKHRADVLKAYIEHLESSAVTVKLLDCDLAAVQHMSGGSKDYCNGFVDGTQNAIRAMRSAGVDVREAE